MEKEFKTVREYINAHPETERERDEDIKAFLDGTYKAGSSPLLKEMEAMFGPLTEEKE